MLECVVIGLLFVGVIEQYVIRQKSSWFNLKHTVAMFMRGQR